tara:strand:+ start:135658 stop:138300 length:2643 start_codon:yes stop_codon:yes gene_type:complete
MSSRRSQLVFAGTLAAVLVSAITPLCALASPEDDQVAAYLQEHHMLGLLKAQLKDRLSAAQELAANDQDPARSIEHDQAIEALVEQLAGIYLQELKAIEQSDPYRAVVQIQAQSLLDAMPRVGMYELRIELIVGEYLQIEPAVELHRLELLDDADRIGSAAELIEVTQQLGALSAKLDLSVNSIEHKLKSTPDRKLAELKAQIADLRRFRSLAHYYHAWGGYSLAVLEDRAVDQDAFVSFGWLLGSQGSLPQLSEFNETTLEFDHVARAAIGVAMAYAQSQEPMLGRAWLRQIIESTYTTAEINASAKDRLFQVNAMAGEWITINRMLNDLINHLIEEPGEHELIAIAQARFIALRALRDIEADYLSERDEAEANEAARIAIEQLIKHGEIGHVLDLYTKFETLPLVADSFITNYARALAELNQAQQMGDAGRYASVATLFVEALNSKDADRFPIERDDCTLKLAFVEIQSGRPREALIACDLLIKQSANEQTIEEARWMRIAALDGINVKANRSSSTELDQAVETYIAAYPTTNRTAKLVLRYAMKGTVDPLIAIDSLSTIADNDPIALPARRTLVQLRYQRQRAKGFKDQQAIADLLTMIKWITDNQPADTLDTDDAKARIQTFRIGLDLALRSSPPDTQAVRELLKIAQAIVDDHLALRSFVPELLYRQLEIELLEDQIESAITLLAELESIDQNKGDSARVLVFNRTIKDWQDKPSERSARMLIDLGAKVLAKESPPHPEPLGVQVSSVAEIITQAGAYLWESHDDDDARSLALRLALLVLDRGDPTEPGLRRTALLAERSDDLPHALDAWLRLLGAYPESTDDWYQARYESLKLMLAIDPLRAQDAYAQFQALHPNASDSQWGESIAQLFGEGTP